MLKAVPCCLALALAAAPARAQLPTDGGEFQVHTVTAGSQYDPEVAMDAAGNFVVVWRGNQDDLGDIFGQRFHASRAPIGAEFRVNTNAGGIQAKPAVAMAPSGAFVVVWDGFGYSAGAVKAQRYDAQGQPSGGEFQVNTHTPGSQYGGSVATDAAGNFVVVWTGGGHQDGSSSGIFGQRYTAAGLPVGEEFQVNTYTTGYQFSSRVAVDAAGGFVVVWHSMGQDGDGFGVFGRRFSSAGAPLGGEFQVNTTIAGWQRYPAVARDPAGSFVVAWAGYYQDGDKTGVFARLYDPDTTPLGAEFQVNTFTTGDQTRPAVAFGRHGDVVAVWESWNQDGALGGVFAQRYSDLIFGDGFDPGGP